MLPSKSNLKKPSGVLSVLPTRSAAHSFLLTLPEFDADVNTKTC